MSGRGRRAALPDPGEGHSRPSPVDATGLVVTHVSEKGDDRMEFDFATLPVPERLQRELAECFAAQFAPIGRWRTIVTSERRWYYLRNFATCGTSRRSCPSRTPRPGRCAS